MFEKHILQVIQLTSATQLHTFISTLCMGVTCGASCGTLSAREAIISALS